MGGYWPCLYVPSFLFCRKLPPALPGPALGQWPQSHLHGPSTPGRQAPLGRYPLGIPWAVSPRRSRLPVLAVLGCLPGKVRSKLVTSLQSLLLVESLVPVQGTRLSLASLLACSLPHLCSYGPRWAQGCRSPGGRPVPGEKH